MKESKLIFVASDHGGFHLKEELLGYLRETNSDLEFLDLGCPDTESVDYPDYAEQVAEKVIRSKEGRGILICGSGIGMSMAANKFGGIRAALCWDATTARLSREHNDANILCLGARIIGAEVAKEICDVWLTTDFEGGRHQRRVDGIHKWETQS